MGMSVTISTANHSDAEKILKLQYLCYQGEAELYGDYTIEPLTQTLDDLRAELAGGTVLVARLGEEVVGSVRGAVDDDGTARIGKLIVHPRMQRHGLGGRLLAALEDRLAAEAEAKRYRLFTGHRSQVNLRMYRKLGYEQVGAAEPVNRRLSLVYMEKSAPEPPARAGNYAATA
ncbi:Acetyltransferase (GNAT) family protein [Actinacidiphila yanglinensis]|uniref:Acetyltransferase (GNAT) family protein n=1 Tax=Actinacidiphila yanglinensis TaxID=310779 RepID=A0A1H6CKN2_9ACTN|nr:GNAT family N-acetyltransferase [Actinacidiphila yanglinensis]SEG72986.1 Acetyltransferase (GNAT) family protein [Actinacidiphila yanglinensis]